MKALVHWGVPLAAAASLMFTAGCVPAGFTVGGKVTGLAGSNLSLSLNGAETLAITKTGAYKFTTRLPTAATYTVSVATQPAGQTCTVANASGMVANLNVSNINVSCAALPEFHIGGSVTGLLGELTIALSDGDSLTLAGDGAYQFETTLENGELYDVSITTQPAGQQCTVSDGTGTINLLDAAVNINCVTTASPPVITHVWPGSVLGGYEVKISGSNLDFASIAFNGAAMTPTLQTPNELRFIAPENPKGTYALELENIAGATSRSVVQGEVMTGVVAMDSGDGHSCAVLTGGAVHCWGRNGSGQLGNGTTLDSAMPVTSYMYNAKLVSVGGAHSCALSVEGNVVCWGSNDTAQMGQGSTSQMPFRAYTPNIGTRPAISISSSFGGNCVVLDSGTVRCWGLTSNSLSYVPETLSGISNAVSVSAGSNHSCVVLSTGSVQCWGANQFGQIGNGTTSTDRSPTLVNGVTNAVSVSVGESHSCAALNTGIVQCWGNNSSGQLGNDTTDMSPIPVTVNGISNAISVKSYWEHSCALLSTGVVQCWGNNSDGQLGNGSTTNSTTPVTVSGISGAVAVSAGAGRSCALLSSGAMQCWGYNQYGQLGNGSTTQSTTPVTVSNISGAVSVSVGSNGHSCAVLASGAVQCWGYNNYGQLGNGSTTQSTTPVTVSTISGAVSVSAGNGHSCAVLASGAVQCWGYNSFGLGDDGSTTQSVTPVTVTGISDAVAVSAAQYHSCAVLASRAVQCWGWNGFGQLGNGSTAWQSSTPVTVVGISNAVAVSAVNAHSCAVLASGAVQCWGYNGYGQLGNGSVTNSSTPVTVVGVSNAVAVSVGDHHSCAVLASGAVQCWGWNANGQLGDGSMTNSSTPVTVVGVSNAVAVSVGNVHSCAASGTGAVQCWGYNYYGQLGNGSTTNSLTQVTVNGISGAVAVSAGGVHSCARLNSGAVQCWGSNGTGQLALPTTLQPELGLPVYYQ